MAKHRVSGVEFSYLSCLVMGRNSNLTSNKMADLRCQGITVDNDNNPYPDNIPYQVPQAENAFDWKLEGIVLTTQFNSLYHTYAVFKKYSPEVVMNMKKLQLFIMIIYC